MQHIFFNEHKAIYACKNNSIPFTVDYIQHSCGGARIKKLDGVSTLKNNRPQAGE
jgi:hypothetical protein